LAGCGFQRPQPVFSKVIAMHEQLNRPSAFQPAIDALQADLAELERQAAQTKQLIDALCARAGIADAPTIAEELAKVPKAKGTRGQPLKPGPGRGKKGKTGGTKSKPPVSDTPTLAELGVTKRQSAQAPAAQATKADSARELTEVVAAIGEANKQVETARRGKDVAAIKEAVSSMMMLEQRGGKLLTVLGGRVKPLPVTKADRKRWKETSMMTAVQLERKLKRAMKKALTGIDGAGPGAGNIGAASSGVSNKNIHAPSARLRGRQRHEAAPRLQVKLTGWRKDSHGILSRKLTSVEIEGAKVDGQAAET